MSRVVGRFRYLSMVSPCFGFKGLGFRARGLGLRYLSMVSPCFGFRGLGFSGLGFRCLSMVSPCFGLSFFVRSIRQKRNYNGDLGKGWCWPSVPEARGQRLLKAGSRRSADSVQSTYTFGLKS